MSSLRNLDVRQFVLGTADAVFALHFRVKRAVSPLDSEPIDYDGIVRALDLIDDERAQRALLELREMLPHVAQNRDDISSSRLMFLGRVAQKARDTGDQDLVATFSIAFAYEAALHGLGDMPSSEQAVRTLQMVFANGLVSRFVRFQAVVTLAELLTARGLLHRAAIAVRQSRRIAVNPVESARCLALSGDISMGRGFPQQAKSRYERAVNKVGGWSVCCDKHPDLVFGLVQAQIESGLRSDTDPDASEILSRASFAPECNFVTARAVALSARRGTRIGTSYRHESLTNQTLMTVGNWRDRRRTALASAYYDSSVNDHFALRTSLRALVPLAVSAHQYHWLDSRLLGGRVGSGSAAG